MKRFSVSTGAFIRFSLSFFSLFFLPLFVFSPSFYFILFFCPTRVYILCVYIGTYISGHFCSALQIFVAEKCDDKRGSAAGEGIRCLLGCRAVGTGHRPFTLVYECMYLVRTRIHHVPNYTTGCFSINRENSLKWHYETQFGQKNQNWLSYVF